MYAGKEFELKVTDQVFSYWMNEQLLHFNVSLLHRVRLYAPKLFRLIDLPLTQDIYDLCMKHRGIEEPRVAALGGKSLREPGYLILWNVDSPIPDYTVVDGHHRLVRRFRGGVHTMSFWAAPEMIWRQVLMPSTPDEDAVIASKIPDRVEARRNILSEVTMKKGV